MRESVTNIIRHSKAKSCRIQVFNQNQLWHLIVSDDGIGWSGGFGNGLLGMKERLVVHGGKLKLESTNPGTRLSVVVGQVLEGDLYETD